MRKLIFLCCVLQCTLLSAQDWALINPAYKYNYSNDGTDTISNQIYVTHIDTLGVDSVRYELNLIAKLCDTCSTPGLFLLLDQPQFMQRKVNVGTDVWHFHDPGSQVILPQANLGEVWVFDTLAGITATVSAEDVVQVFGNDMSRKVIDLSDGGTIEISETYGVLRWNESELIGVHGPDLGMLIPSLEEMFPYQAGDVVEYSTGAGGTDGISSNFGHSRLYKFTVSDGVPVEGAMLFDGSMIDHRWQWTSYWNGPVYVSYGHQTTFGNSWTAGRPELPWADLLTSYPGQLIGYANNVELWSDTLICIARHGMDEQGRYTYGCKTIVDPTGNGTGHFMSVPFEPSTSGPVSTTVRNYCNGTPDEECGVLYTMGVGLNWLRGNYFESYEEYVLIGSVIDGDTVGTVDSDEHLITLSVPFHENSSIVITPNPANDHILLSSSTPGTTCTIFNATGQVLFTHPISSSMEPIDVSGLAPGLYLLNMAGIGPIRFVIAR